jgi:hypothetical protein
VIGRAETRLGKVRWMCVCECGEQRTVAAISLMQGTSKSCGCLKREARAWNFRHGESHSAEYEAWVKMRQRCLNPRCHAYGRYGGRGITICPRWLNSFEAFLADLGRKPSARRSLDRRNNNGNYEPSNVRWATPAQQNRNRGF